MTAMDRPEFAAALAQLFAAWGRVVGEDQADAYWRYLSDLPMGSVLDGIEAAAREGGRYVPTVGQIRDAIQGQRGGPRDTRAAVDACEVCDGTGWVVSARVSSLGYSQVRPCECPRGRATFVAKKLGATA